MTQEEILEYNKKCAEFLGAEIQDVLERIYIDKMKDDEMIFHNHSVILQTYEWNGTTNIHYIPFDMLQFHSDWNWIMKVVEAIEKLGYQFDITGNEVGVNSNTTSVRNIATGGTMNSYNEIYYPTIISVTEEEYSKKEAVVQAINQFLIWYSNEQRT